MKHKLDFGIYQESINAAAIYAINQGFTHVYGIPRGGTQVAVSIAHSSMDDLKVSSHPVSHTNKKCLIVDDVVTTGETLKPYLESGYTCLVLFSKGFAHENLYSINQIDPFNWIVFPWEREREDDGEILVKRMLEYIGEDITREGLIETPKRVAKAWGEWFSGYSKKPENVVKVFEDDTSDEMVILKDIEFYSHCEHHIAPFFGKAHVAYIPNKHLLGASKLARLVDIYARRLQIQERICTQVTTAINDLAQPLGSACYIEAKHFCIASRGIGKQNSIFVTSSLTGVFKDNPSARNEFYQAIK